MELLWGGYMFVFPLGWLPVNQSIFSILMPAEMTCIEASLPPEWHQIEPRAVIKGIMGFISAKTAWLGPSLF
jgi:hypothetical protein